MSFVKSVLRLLLLAVAVSLGLIFAIGMFLVVGVLTLFGAKRPRFKVYTNWRGRPTPTYPSYQPPMRDVTPQQLDA